MDHQPPAAGHAPYVATVTSTAPPAPPAPDVALVFEDGTQLLAHSSILSIASPVFADLLLACCCDAQAGAFSADVTGTSDQCQGHTQHTAASFQVTGTQKHGEGSATAGAVRPASSSKGVTLGRAGSLHAAALLRAAGAAAADDGADMPGTELQPFFQSAAEAAPPAGPVMPQGATDTAAASVTAQPSYSMQSVPTTSETSSAAPAGVTVAKVPMIGDSRSAWCELLAYLHPPPVGATTGRPVVCWANVESFVRLAHKYHMTGVLASCEAFLLDSKAAPLSGAGGASCVWRCLLLADQLLRSQKLVDRCLKFLSSSAMLPLPDARPFEAPAEVLGSLSPGALSRLVDHLVLCSTTSSAAVQQEGRKVARKFTAGGFRWALVDDYSLTKPPRHGPGGWWMNMP